MTIVFRELVVPLGTYGELNLPSRLAVPES